MIRWMNKVFRFGGKAADLGRPDPTNLEATLNAAQHMSMNRENRDETIVVVEMAARFNVSTGQYLDRQFNYYTNRGSRDFNEIGNLKAAFRNGVRVDTLDRANSGRMAIHSGPDQEVRYVTFDRDSVAVGGRAPNTSETHE